jgi:hypothetical protein
MRMRITVSHAKHTTRDVYQDTYDVANDLPADRLGECVAEAIQGASMAMVNFDPIDLALVVEFQP